MADKVGLGSQYGLAAETTVGTYATPTKFFPFTTVNGNLDVNEYRSKGLQPGQYAQQSALTVKTTRSGTFSVSRELLSKGEGVLFNTLHGATVTPTTTTSPAYAQAHPIALTLPDGRALSQQYVAPGTDGTQNVITGLGTVPTSFKFSAEAGGVVMTEQEFFASDIDYTKSKASATYAASPELFPFQNITVLWNGSQLRNPTSFDVTVTIPRATDRYFLAGTATPGEALVNDYVSVSGNITMELSDTAQLAAVLSNTRPTLKITCLGNANIATSRKAKFELDFAGVDVMPHSAQVSGPDLIKVTVPFEALIVSTSPLVTINYESLDSTI